MNSDIKENFTVAEDGSIEQSSNELDTAMLNIIRLGASKDDILAAYNARKKCYKLCKKYAKRPYYKEYVQILQLDNFPNELKKADYGTQYVIRRNVWLSLLVISAYFSIVGAVMHIEDPTCFEKEVFYFCGGVIFFFSIICLIKMILIVRKIKSLINDTKE